MIHYTVIGQGQPLVLIHGFPNDSSAWEPLLPALTERYRVLLPDLPGAGQSPLPDTPLSLEYMAAEIAGMLDREQIPLAVLAGHSMGGYSALEFAAHYPGRLKGVSLVHSLASPDSEEKKENRRKAIALIRKGEAEKEMFLRGMAQNLFAESYAARHPEMVRKVVDTGMKLSTASLAAFYQAIMERSDKRELLDRLDCPLQWIIGNEDTATPMKDALEQCHRARVNAVSLYEPCGHMSFLEHPDWLATDMIAFLEHCYRDAGPQ
ncbi:alpha/beta fold hydrolase [Taibaiella koreensis]|uniref:alpha/beta fold hydrolase n=1 Tax=Taibaiella koreensis TaxID=1268548 RepID=UPI0013C37400|nr:alpha/beta hydrolase [Taibaiella koreensis]